MNIHDTEVKIILESSGALQKDFLLSCDIRDFLKINEAPHDMKIWFLDTEDTKLKGEGWLARYRYREGNDFELTYKKRYTEDESKSLSPETLVRFTDFKPEIDMGISKKTYSFSKEITIPLSDRLLMLDPADAKRIAIINSPVVFTDWKGINSGFCALCESRLFGPVSAVEYKGLYSGIEASVEVWKLGSFITELSLKVSTDKSEDIMSRLLAEPIIKRLAVSGGKLKTETLFDYYSNP